ncbi:DNA photolyase family protein [Enterovibrio sp. ZSDZ42]|uniref:DNA photolyase family protein n=1 Tax=Enterovibrio gelatinilyticus TaxID=2899819 RepID=A0ABT5R283_9GAMM|nr:deoxyribodipyrimidine photo-lyase [Enterovibrio sp. ZSDZ42]MDD1794383.1 DNA photolyase family protein [Enterovibrio sp. ZSDZ42]
MAISVVWLKRDLRLTDHEPLLRAAQSGLPVLLMYSFEPMLIDDPHYDERHWRFVGQSLQDMQARLPQGAMLVSHRDAVDTLSTIHQTFGIAHLFSHQEVGLNNTFERDISVKSWCEQHSVVWNETPFGAVIRGLTNRQTWDKHWQKVMRAPQANCDIQCVHWASVEPEVLPAQIANYVKPGEHAGCFQHGGEQAAWQMLNGFFEGRGKDYAYSLSSPTLSQTHCSRVSAYLAWGNLSLRQVYQIVLGNWNKKGWRRSLVALSSRLHWHCHFIQKFESEASMEFEPVNRGYLELPRVTGAEAPRRLTAWKEGKTGFPMVDASMRCLHATGYLNFRMRAMLVSFLCHHLALDWRLGVKHLASVFLDFEPGIHYSQFQMQAGVTGINTIRIYNPVKQGEEKDPDGIFVKTWLPELAEIPAPLVHSPWQLSPMEQMMYAVNIGSDYPEPIVDLKQSYSEAQALLWRWRKLPDVQQEAHRLLKRHVRPD